MYFVQVVTENSNKESRTAHVLLKGPEDYQRFFFHTEREGNIWLDGKIDSITRDILLMGTEVESISPSEMWKGRSTRSNIHSTEAPAHRGGVTNSTTVDNSSPPLNLPYSPIHQSDDSVRHKEQFVRDLRSDPSMPKHMIDEALSKVNRSVSDQKRSGLELSVPPTNPIHDYTGISHQGLASKQQAPPTYDRSALDHQGSTTEPSGAAST